MKRLRLVLVILALCGAGCGGVKTGSAADAGADGDGDGDGDHRTEDGGTAVDDTDGGGPVGPDSCVLGTSQLGNCNL